MKPKVLIVAIHGPYEPWLSILKDGQVKTWMAENSNSTVVNVFGRRINLTIQQIDQKLYYLRWSKTKLVAYSALSVEAALKKVFSIDRFRPKVGESFDKNFGNVWEIDMPDSLLLQGLKNMTVFRHSLMHNFDYLVTTITSTYLNVDLLEKFLLSAEPNGFAGGRIEHSGMMSFQQGSLRVYSRDVVEEIVRNSKKYKHWKIEDIAMGDLISSLNYKVVEIPNMTLQAPPEVSRLLAKDLETTISYRCKSTVNGKRLDSTIMQALHSKIFKL